MLGYTYQDTNVLFSGVTLESTYQSEATTKPTKSFATGGLSKIDFSVNYTTGAGETNNSIEIKLEASPDGTNWYQLTNDSTSSGTSTLYQREFTFVGALAATSYKFSLPIDVFDRYMRVSAKETGVATNKGTVTITATFSGAK